MKIYYNIKNLIVSVIILCFVNDSLAQNEQLPYMEIPNPSEVYTAGAVVSRMIDGLGFRFYWATEGLRIEDLTFKPSNDARTTAETLNHILELVQMIHNTALKKDIDYIQNEELSILEKRSITLKMLKTSSDIFRNAQHLGQFQISFYREGKQSEYPFWNQINGPISDALWHCGQIVSHRRTSGNPFNSKVNVFKGTVSN
ncbi:hypothetical protein N8768_02835 [Flavobacteriaceae bacterium]|jgi:hypothetical protein|nr:hypothetical protein [Flavobacteriaceae bacterium]